LSKNESVTISLGSSYSNCIILP